MRCQFIIAVVAVAVLIGASPQGAGKTDQDALQGVWRGVSGEKDGKAIPPATMKDFQLMVKGATMELRTKVNNEVVILKVDLKLDSNKRPRQVDMTTQGTSEKMSGIYEIAGDELKLCISSGSKDRPAEFKSEVNSQASVLVFKREKK